MLQNQRNDDDWMAGRRMCDHGRGHRADLWAPHLSYWDESVENWHFLWAIILDGYGVECVFLVPAKC